jgi:signal transduction histidine kinase
VAQERLTRQELGWLLAQEARSAARALREGVTHLKQPSAPGVQIAEREGGVETTLDALDETIGMLSELQGPHGAQRSGRRGRIDLASLLCEIAPTARIAMEPGAGTEVHGDEAELRRLLHVLMSQSAGSPGEGSVPEVRIRRDDDWVRISVELGPDSSPTASMERRWLNRMAIRYGGKLELEGGTQSLVLPADAAGTQREMQALRKELEQAQQLGEAYARELAAAFASGDALRESSVPAAPSTAATLESLVAMAGALARPLRKLLEGLRQDAAAAQAALGETAPLAESLGRRSTAIAEIAGELGRLGGCVLDPPATFDVAAMVREAVEDAEARAARHGVRLRLQIAPRLEGRTSRGPFAALVRALLDHAIAATPRDGEVVLCVTAPRGLLLVAEDGGPSVPVPSRSALVASRVDPTSLGRPAGLALLIAEAVATYLGGALLLEESETGRAETRVTLPA